MNGSEIYRRSAKALEYTTKRIILIFFVVILCVSAYMSYDTYYVLYQASASAQKRFKPPVITAESLGELSEDAVAWIEVDDTSIDYPIMQGSDNTEYLNKNPYGEYSLSGSIFLDSFNSPDFTDPFSVVYGHHMAGGLMFGALDGFVEEAWFESHRTGTLHVGDRKFKFETIGFVIADAKDDEIFDSQFADDRWEFIEARVQHYHPESITEHVVALTTCRTADATDRTILLIGLIGR